VGYVKRTAQPAEGTVPSPASASPAWGLRFPALTEYLVATAWEDGEERTPATLLLLTEVGLWKGCLHDRDEGRSLWRSGRTEEAVLTALESALASGEADWRRDSGKRSR